MAKKLETKKVLDEKQFGNTKMRNRLAFSILWLIIAYVVLAVALIAILLAFGVDIEELYTPWTLLVLLTLLCFFDYFLVMLQANSQSSQQIQDSKYQ